MTGRLVCCGGWTRLRRGVFAVSVISTGLSRVSMSSDVRDAQGLTTGVSVGHVLFSVRTVGRATRRGILVVLLQFVRESWQAFSLGFPRVRLPTLQLACVLLLLAPVVLSLVSHLQVLLVL